MRCMDHQEGLSCQWLQVNHGVRREVVPASLMRVSRDITGLLIPYKYQHSTGAQLTVKVDVVRATLDEGAAAHALGRLCAVPHLHRQLRCSTIRNHQHAPAHLLALWVKQWQTRLSACSTMDQQSSMRQPSTDICMHKTYQGSCRALKGWFEDSGVQLAVVSLHEPTRKQTEPTSNHERDTRAEGWALHAHIGALHGPKPARPVERGVGLADLKALPELCTAVARLPGHARVQVRAFHSAGRRAA